MFLPYAAPLCSSPMWNWEISSKKYFLLVLLTLLPLLLINQRIMCYNLSDCSTCREISSCLRSEEVYVSLIFFLLLVQMSNVFGKCWLCDLSLYVFHCFVEDSSYLSFPYSFWLSSRKKLRKIAFTLYLIRILNCYLKHL